MQPVFTMQYYEIRSMNQYLIENRLEEIQYSFI